MDTWSSFYFQCKLSYMTLYKIKISIIKENKETNKKQNHNTNQSTNQQGNWSWLLCRAILLFKRLRK